jgi:hypothetical protein
MQRIFLKTVLLWFILFSLLFSKPAYAYLDPGIGSYLLQIALAFLLAAFFAMKLFYRKLKNAFKKIFFKNKADKPTDE